MQVFRATLDEVQRRRASTRAICAVVGQLALLISGELHADERTTVFVAFDGVLLEEAEQDDAALDRTAIAQLAGEHAAWSGDASERAAVLQRVREHWAAYPIDFVDARPSEPAYVMAVVTDGAPLGPGVSGAAVLDCDDARGPGEVVFAFAGSSEARAVAATISQELGHAFGLEHTDDTADLMYPFAQDGEQRFADECTALAEGASCDDVHARHCELGSQSAHAELLDVLGSAIADSDAPEVEIVRPEDGDVFVAGTDVQIVVDASDDVHVDRVTVFEGVREVGHDDVPPFELVVTAIPAGDFEVRVVATDAAGNAAESATITITARAPGWGPGYPDVDRGRAAQGCAVAAPAFPLGVLVLLALACRPRRVSSR